MAARSGKAKAMARTRSEPEVLRIAREAGNSFGLATALLELAEATPLFSDALTQVEDWLSESRDLAHRIVLPPRCEVTQIVRLSEVLLASGAALEAFDVATEAARLANNADLPGLVDRAWTAQARALVRLERQDDAIRLFNALVEHDVPHSAEDRLVPGLAFLAFGEAHLFQGRYDTACAPLEQSLLLLPQGPAADRLRYDALVGLGMLDHRQGELDTSAIRFEAAMRIADTHASRPEQLESLLLSATLWRGRGRIEASNRCLQAAIGLSPLATPPARPLTFPTERLRNLVGQTTVAELIEGASELARDCGHAGYLMGYVQIVALVATLHAFEGRVLEGLRLLNHVSLALLEAGHGDAVEALQRHRLGYEPYLPA